MEPIELRKRSGWLWWPMTINGVTKWLTTAVWVEAYLVPSWGSADEEGWYPEYWFVAGKCWDPDLSSEENNAILDRPSGEAK